MLEELDGRVAAHLLLLTKLLQRLLCAIHLPKKTSLFFFSHENMKTLAKTYLPSALVAAAAKAGLKVLQ